MRQWPHLRSQNVVIRVEDITVQCVSEQTTKRESLQNMFQRRRQANTQLPSSMCFVQLEFTSYHFPKVVGHSEVGQGKGAAAQQAALAQGMEQLYPVPPDSTHLVVGPSDVLVDYKSIRWLVYVFENILNAWEAPQMTQAVEVDDSTTYVTPYPVPTTRVQ